MRKYETYKESGIEWLGDIPTGWTVNRLKNLGYATIGITYSPENICNEDEGILVLRSSNIQDDKFCFKDNVYVYFKPRKKYLTRLNDILICSRNGSRRLIGKNVRVDEENVGKTFGAFMTIYRSSMNDFISYFFKSQLFDYQSGAFMTSTINQLTIGTLNLLHLAVPPLPEQKAIAQYLDNKTQAIDKKVSLLEKKIDYYTELRVSIINDAVTKGLDKTVELKDSGIDWIGQIPTHWGVTRVKDLFKISRGRVIAKTELLDDGKFPVFSSQTENKGILGYINTYDFDTDLITWTTDGVNAGTVFRRAGKFSCTNICGTLIPKNSNKTSLDYFGYAIAESTQHNKRIDTNGAKIMSNEMAVIHIIEPPTKEEQTEIAQYLDDKTSTIDAIVTNIEKQIDHLKDLRKTVINDVVTGKIKVIE